jgi:hypothetical protein
LAQSYGHQLYTHEFRDRTGHVLYQNHIGSGKLGNQGGHQTRERKVGDHKNLTTDHENNAQKIDDRYI